MAALAICEAVLRLLPGFMGNAASLVEESHGVGGLLEAPVYTKPPVWRGRAVPEVLLSGDHERIAAWRREQSRERTVQRRPDLAAPATTLAGLAGADLRAATPADVGELFTLQRACWLAEARANPALGVEGIPALVETIEELRASLAEWTTFVVRHAGRLVAAGRGRAVDGPEGPATVWDVGRLMVAPDLQGRGLGTALLAVLEDAAPPTATSNSLFTGAGSAANQRLYRRAGYRVRRGAAGVPDGAVLMTKPRRPRPA